ILSMVPGIGASTDSDPSFTTTSFFSSALGAGCGVGAFLVVGCDVDAGCGTDLWVVLTPSVTSSTSTSYWFPFTFIINFLILLPPIVNYYNFSRICSLLPASDHR